MTNMRDIVDAIEVLLTVLLVDDGAFGCFDLKWLRIVRNR
jgi:hypothetical protein